MSIWKRLRGVASRAETSIDGLKNKINNRFNRNAVVSILPYMGQGKPNEVRMRGRVVQNRRVRVSTDGDSVWRNLLNMYRRLESDEIPYAGVTATCNGQTRTVTADDEGYFRVVFEFDEALDSENIWQEIHLAYDDGRRQAQAIGKVMIPPPDARFGIISDLDDTVIRTDVINLLKLVRNVFFKNAQTRLPFHGVAEFYNALQNAGNTFNPVFYVSNSPYNLYDLITDFFSFRGIPMGPVYLRDIGLTEQYLVAHHRHKYERVERLLQFYPDLPFVLIGDSGEKDARIYLEIIQNYPGRIKAVYIRDVEPHLLNTRRDAKVRAIAEKSQTEGVEMLLVPDTEAAARHAVEHGLIEESALSAIIQGRKIDEQSTAIETESQS